MDQQNKDLIRRFYDAVWSDGRLDAAGAFLAEDLVDHNPMQFPGRERGVRGFLQVVETIRDALPDLRRTIEDQVSEDDLVVTRFTDRGTHRGPLMGIPPTGRTVTVGGINIERVVGGRIAEIWHLEDMVGLLQQLGAFPGSEGSATG